VGGALFLGESLPYTSSISTQDGAAEVLQEASWTWDHARFKAR